MSRFTIRLWHAVCIISATAWGHNHRELQAVVTDVRSGSPADRAGLLLLVKSARGSRFVVVHLEG